MAKTARLTAVVARRSDRAARTSSGVPTSASNAELTGRLRRDEQALSKWVADMGGDIDRRQQRDYRFGGRGTAGERAGLSNSLADAGRQVDRRRDSEAEHLLRAGEIAARYGEGGVLATDAAGLRRSALADLDAERKATAAWLPRAARTIAHTAAAGRMVQAGQIAGLVGTLHKDLGALVQSGDMEAAELNCILDWAEGFTNEYLDNAPHYGAPANPYAGTGTPTVRKPARRKGGHPTGAAA